MATSFYFGKHFIPLSQIFYLTPLTFSFVNIRPVTQGHVLISPKRIVRRYYELTDEESIELWTAVQKISNFLGNFYQTSCDICIQDGQNAGQTVQHVHVHIVPAFVSYLDIGKLIIFLYIFFIIFREKRPNN